jgi:hypothetical protein
MSRQDQYNVVVSVTFRGETRALGTFDQLSGGEVDSEETKFTPGNLGQQISLGGRRAVGNVTVARLYDMLRDHPNMGWLMAGVGKADVVVTKIALDVDGNAYASPIVYTGKLKQLNMPEHDSESNDAALFEMEISSANATQ